MVSRNTEFNTDRFLKAYGVINAFGRYRNMKGIPGTIDYLGALPLDRNQIATKDLPTYDAYQYFNHCRLRHPERMKKGLELLKICVGYEKVHNVNYPELLAKESARDTASRKIQTHYRGHLAKKATNRLHDDIIKFVVADTKEEKEIPTSQRIYVMREDRDRKTKQRLGTVIPPFLTGV